MPRSACSAVFGEEFRGFHQRGPRGNRRFINVALFDAHQRKKILSDSSRLGCVRCEVVNGDSDVLQVVQHMRHIVIEHELKRQRFRTGDGQRP